MANVKVRIPIRELTYSGPIELEKNILKIVTDEVNVQKIKYVGKSDYVTSMGETSDITNSSNQDEAMGQAERNYKVYSRREKKISYKIG